MQIIAGNSFLTCFELAAEFRKATDFPGTRVKTLIATVSRRWKKQKKPGRVKEAEKRLFECYSLAKSANWRRFFHV